MIKYSLLTLFTSITLFFSAVLADGVVIDHNLPDQLNPGESVVVSVVINKADITGFAKLQLEIPQGFSVTPVKKNGASFTFSGQKAKFIWMSLPDEQEFTVEYELTANPSASGPLAITGQFSYIKENERVDYDLPTKVVNVGVVVAQDSTPDTETTPEDGTTVEDETTTTGTTTETAEEIPATITSTTAESSRIISKISDNEYFVEVSTTGVDSDGFAKLTENFSNDYIVTSSESGESLATVEEERIKFIWFEKPADDSYSISYTLLAKDNEVAPEIDGTFSFIKENQPMETKVVQLEMISAKDFNEPTDLAENTTETEDPKTTATDVAEVTPPKVEERITTTVTVPEVTETITEEPVTTTAAVKEEPEEEELTASTVPDPEVGITYKVQLSATHKYITAEKFKATHKFKESIQTENHEGWTKFVTGSHDVYKDARDARNTISAAYPKFKGPFVTAYNSGERITVQEALMISKQKWYQ